MNSKRLRGMLIVFSLVLMIAGGCGKSDNQTIVTIADYEIDTEEFNQYFDQLRMTFATSEEEFNKRREILDSMIVIRLLIEGAYELNIDQDADLARAVNANKDRFLVGTLYQKHVVEKAEPTEAEMRDYYNHLENRIRVSHVLISDPDTAQAVFERVKSGENFEQLAFDYSIDPDAKRNKGDLGYILWGATVNEFQEAAFSMEPGEVSPPVKSQFGYHIIKVIDKLPNENRTDYESMESGIKNQLMRRKAVKLMSDYFEVAKVKYPVVIDTATCDYLLHKREQLYPEAILATLPRNDFDIAALDRNEKELVLATWGGGQVTLSEYLGRIKDIPAHFRPDFDNYDSLAIIVFELKKNDILITEALAEGLDNDEEYLKSLKLFREFNMADIMKNDSIPVPPEPDEAAQRAYYEEQIDEFTTPAKISVHEILLSDELKAVKLAKDIKSLKGFQKQAAEFTERPGKRSRKGDLGYIEQRWYPEIYEAAQNISVGRIGGPVMTLGKYSIFYVVDKIDPEIKDFLNVKRTINDRIIKQQKNDAIQVWVDARLKSTTVEVDDDALWATIDMEKYEVADTTTN